MENRFAVMQFVELKRTYLFAWGTLVAGSILLILVGLLPTVAMESLVESAKGPEPANPPPEQFDLPGLESVGSENSYPLNSF